MATSARINRKTSHDLAAIGVRLVAGARMTWVAAEEAGRRRLTAPGRVTGDADEGTAQVSVQRLPAPSSAAGRAEELARLVYELLDAHADTDQLARGRSTDLRWRAHLDYLRDLQRVWREILAGDINS